MDVMYTLLRLVHIIDVTLWFGMGVATLFFVEPIAAKTMPESQRFLQAIGKGNFRSRSTPPLA